MQNAREGGGLLPAALPVLLLKFTQHWFAWYVTFRWRHSLRSGGRQQGTAQTVGNVPQQVMQHRSLTLSGLRHLPSQRQHAAMVVVHVEHQRSG
jgi:hypothetical protein